MVNYNEETKKCGCTVNSFNVADLRTCIKQIQGIGTSCTQDIQCNPLGLAYCNIVPILKVCECREYAKYDENSQLCVPLEGLNEYCEQTSDCSLPKTVCSERNTCVCESNYIASDDECKPSVDATCTTDNDCSALDGAVCVDDSAEKDTKICQCKSGLAFVGGECIEERELGDACDDDDQCAPLLGALSNCDATEKKCKCDDNAHFRDGKCNTKIGK